MREWFENKSVAVVGNAQSLFSKNHGYLIDSHDIVCRINKGAIIVDDAHQGKKIDVFVFGGLKKFRYLLDILKIDKNLFVSSRKSEEAKKLKNVYLYPAEWRNELKNVLVSYDKEYHPDQEIKNAGEKGERKKPSAGICLLDYISRSSPASVSVFGFDWKATSTYYEKMGGSLTAHDYNFEKYHCLEYFEKNLKYKFY